MDARETRAAPPPPSTRRALLLGLLAYVVIRAFVPFGSTLLYPLTLLATWVHEMGHGVTALVLGGHFRSLDIYADGSGFAVTSNDATWKDGLIAVGGLLAPPIAGATLLGLSRGPRRARIFLVALAIAIALSLVFWVRSFVGLVALPLVGLVLVAVVTSPKIAPSTRMAFVQLLGIVLASDTVSRIDYLFMRSAVIGGATVTSDIAVVARDFGGFYLAWGVLLAVVSCVLLVAGLRAAWRR